MRLLMARSGISWSWVTSMTICVLAAVQITARPMEDKPEDAAASDGWHPEGRSREDWISCRGLPCAEWEDSRDKVALVNALDHSGVPSYLDPSHGEQDPDGYQEGADIVMTPVQAELMLQQVKGHMTGSVREKRKITSNRALLWGLPIYYKFDGTQNDWEVKRIRAALSHWEEHTCARFVEVNKDAKIQESHLMFVKSYLGCFSFIGRGRFGEGSPQPINLPGFCLLQIGVPVHEVGHVMGLWHEHQRPDRDSYVDVVKDNVASWAHSNFEIRPETEIDDRGIDYDVNSVMHYAGRVATANGFETIKTRDSRYQGNIGQRLGLSFLDAKTINMAYCSTKCYASPPLQCQNGGYQDPNDCRNCRCPDGLGGTLCDQVESSNKDCGGDIILQAGETVTLASPGFAEQHSYKKDTICNWRIQVPRGQRVQLDFIGEFSIPTPTDTCNNWVEVKAKADASRPGYRFCSGHRPNDVIISEANQILVSFRTPSTVSSTAYTRGFSAQVSTAQTILPDISFANLPKDVNIMSTASQPEVSLSARSTVLLVTPRAPTPRTSTSQSTMTSSTEPMSRLPVIPARVITPKAMLAELSAAPSGEEIASDEAPIETGSSEEETWSEWSSCTPSGACGCGGCSRRTRHRLCDGSRCTGENALEESESCSRPCGSRDYYAHLLVRHYFRTCPTCCDGYELMNGTCQPI